MTTTKNMEPTMTREALAAIEGAHAAATAEVGRLQAILSGQVGARVTRTEQVRRLTREGVKTVEVTAEHYETREPSRAELVAAKRAMVAADEALLRCEDDLLQARARFDADQRARRLAFTEQTDREQAQQLAVLIRKTDTLAAEWQTFAAAARRRDEQYFSTGPRGDFAVERYTSAVFAPLADPSGEPSMWARFKQLQAEGR